MKNFPSIGEYNQTIQNRGSWAFQTLIDLNFIPSRTFPIKIFSFGSGAYAVVFKASQAGKNYAIRCFLSTQQENISRYQSICNYLNNIDVSWKVNCNFLDNEIEVNGKFYPILTMEWIEGVLINQFVSDNLNNNTVLSELQKQLVETSNSLEHHQIGHGDIQSGNIIIQKTDSDFQVKLIDYDGMYIPSFENSRSLENGRSEFQHPKRTEWDFSPTMDRFSFWVMLTTLEALKYDKSLWKGVMQGGFNTLDNFLFTIQDFANPFKSNLFNRLKQLNQKSVDFYSEKLKQFCLDEINSVEKPFLYREREIAIEKQTQNINIPKETTKKETETPQTGKILIKSKPPGVYVLNSTFQKLGITPLLLNRDEYSYKTVILRYGGKLEKIMLVGDKHNVDFDQKTPSFVEQRNNSDSENRVPEISQKRKNYIFEKIVALIAFIIFMVVMTLLGSSNNKTSEGIHTSSVSSPDKDIVWSKQTVANLSFQLPSNFKLDKSLSSENQLAFIHQTNQHVGFTVGFNEIPSGSYASSIYDLFTDIQTFGKSVHDEQRKNFSDTKFLHNKQLTFAGVDAIEVNLSSTMYSGSNVETIINSNFLIADSYYFAITFSYPKNVSSSTKEVIEKIKKSFELKHSNNVISEDQPQYQVHVKNLNRNSYLKNLTDENIINQFIYAENSNDWERIMFLLSQNMQVFWGKSNPSYSDIYSAYKKRFDNYSDDITDVLKITHNGNREYQVDVKYHSQNKVYYNSIIFKIEKGEIVYIDEAIIDLPSSMHFPKIFYENRINQLFQLNSYNFIENSQMMSNENIKNSMWSYYSQFYAANIDRFYNSTSKMSIYDIVTEQFNYTKIYPEKSYTISDVRIVEDSFSYTKVKYKTKYTLRKSDGNSFRGTTNETIVFNSEGKIIEQFN